MGIQRVGTWGGAEIVSGGISIGSARDSTTWNGPVCGICGVGYLGQHSCSGGITTSNLPMPAPVSASACQHCWCGDPGPYNGKPHVSCCMCATRRVAS